jgi:DNA-binding MarR family transcriptional regulator
MSERDRQAKHRAPRRPSAAGRLSEKTVGMVAATLRVLADPTRIRLTEVLNERGGDTVSALIVCIRSSQQNVSKQLAVLHQAGVVSRRREGHLLRRRRSPRTAAGGARAPGSSAQEGRASSR